jgi:hypothetical protein
MTETYPADEELQLSVSVDSPLDLSHGEVPVAATALLQHRRDRETRYAWHHGGRVDPPLTLVDTDPTATAGTLTVAGSGRLALSVPGGTLAPGRWLFQVAVRVDDGTRQVTPTDPRRIRLTEDNR